MLNEGEALLLGKKLFGYNQHKGIEESCHADNLEDACLGAAFLNSFTPC